MKISLWTSVYSQRHCLYLWSHSAHHWNDSYNCYISDVHWSRLHAWFSQSSCRYSRATHWKRSLRTVLWPTLTTSLSCPLSSLCTVQCRQWTLLLLLSVPGLSKTVSSLAKVNVQLSSSRRTSKMPLLQLLTYSLETRRRGLSTRFAFSGWQYLQFWSGRFMFNVRSSVNMMIGVLNRFGGTLNVNARQRILRAFITLKLAYCLPVGDTLANNKLKQWIMWFSEQHA